MSFIRVLLRLMLLFFILGSVGYLLVRETLLAMASVQIASDVRQLTLPSRWKDFTNRCSGVSVNTAPYDAFQLRFTSPTEYSVEVHCLSTAPVTWKSQKLPFMVTKTTGSSGFYFDFPTKTLQGEISLELWGQSKIVYVQGDHAAQKWGKSTFQASNPASVCVAYGKTCCDPVQELGQGEQQNGGVTDCASQCFSSCQQRPRLLSFQSDPPADYEKRSIALTSNSSLILFTYVVDDTQSPVAKVTVNFGDGTKQELNTASGQVSKEYTCATAAVAPCTYNASIEIIDQRGIPSSPTRISTLAVTLGARIGNNGLVSP